MLQEKLRIKDTTTQRSIFLERFLKFIERAGNKLPDVTSLFIFALIAALLLSSALSFVDFNYYLPAHGGAEPEKIVILNMLNVNNFFNLLGKVLSNFINFPPLGIVLIMTIGVGIIEEAGFLRVLLIKIARVTSRALLTPVVIVVSILSHIVVDSAYVFLMPIAAALFISFGRHPIAGISVAFGALAGAFCAGFVPSIVDPLLQQFTEKAAHIVDPSISVNVLCNYFLSIVSAFATIFACWFVCDKIIEPFLNKNLPVDMEYEKINFKETRLTPEENKAFIVSLTVMAVMAVAIIVACIPENSVLRGSNGMITDGDGLLMRGLVTFLFFFMAIPGYIFGVLNGKYKDIRTFSAAMNNSLTPLLGFIVFAFIAGQFLYVFNVSNLSKLIAISGAEMLKSMAMPSGITLFGVIVFTGFLNLLVTSATSKWAVLAYVFVPMLMLLGISPELTQAAFRVSDSAINVITPMFPFYPLLIGYCKKYCSTTGIGTLSSIMIPYSLALMIVLTATLYLFWAFNIPMGFEAVYTYEGLK